ncbi:mechanosensitive ion channel [Pseudidiomarina sp. 1APP75-27a]|uniref:mechanosensitive ion channel family protein n=1 Tax=Pseudidiomarina terrestris TaxID=2820060 RepID=UPI002B05F130|nr:mechanosensitive ion channel domain-containing protein [Pseudidiomarina sp. 1APP75-27a]MEA3587538.1 mechanosensitive ion channel [Pseudidiomarina sp. 1APP75-27a]
MTKATTTDVVSNIVTTIREAFHWLNSELFSVGETAVTYGAVLRFVVILVAAWIVSVLLQKALQRYANFRNSLAPSSVYALKRITHYVVLLVGFLLAVSSIGIDLTKFAIFASALGIGVGFGLQNLISNFVSGIILLFDKTLKVGDFVELESGVTGEVQEINIRSTIITTNDNIDIIVPNSEFVSGRVTNWTMRDTYRRIKVSFGVAYGTDKELVKKAVLEAAERVPHTLTDTHHRPPQVWLVEFGESALNFELVVWLRPEAVNRPGAVQAAFMWEIHTSLMEHKIEIPFPQRDLHVKTWNGEKAQVHFMQDRSSTASTENEEPAPEPPSKNDAAEEL